MRLADALPSAWEGEDIALVGVVDELPQRSDRGTRFAFAVERVETADAIVPRRLSLAWYAQWQKGGPSDPVPDLVAGERWRLVVRLKRPHGTVNPHGFDVEAWLLRERAARDRLRAQRRAQRCGSMHSPDARRTTCSGPGRTSARASSPRCRTRASPA